MQKSKKALKEVSGTNKPYVFVYGVALKAVNI